MGGGVPSPKVVGLDSECVDGATTSDEPDADSTAGEVVREILDMLWRLLSMLFSMVAKCRYPGKSVQGYRVSWASTCISTMIKMRWRMMYDAGGTVEAKYSSREGAR